MADWKRRILYKGYPNVGLSLVVWVFWKKFNKTILLVLNSFSEENAKSVDKPNHTDKITNHDLPSHCVVEETRVRRMPEN